jgi:hypothetical protein
MRDHDQFFPALMHAIWSPVFNHGVLLLLCGGSSTHFSPGPEIS